MIDAIGYIRVSTEEQAESGLSLAHQRAKIEAYCVATDLNLLAVYEDAGKSAKNMDRPALQEALEQIKIGKAKALIILKLDRLTRSVHDLGALLPFFEKKKASLVSVQDSINTQTAAGRLVVHVLGSIAQWEREATGERTAAALAVKRSRGEKTGGTVPYGFTVGEDGKLVPNPEEQKSLEIMRSCHGKGMSLRQIAAELQASGVAPIPKLVKGKYTKGVWHPQTIKKILGR